MPKGKKIDNFFAGHKRQVKELKWEHLVTRAGEHRIKMHLSMPLIGQPMQNFPPDVSEVFGLLGKDKSASTFNKIGIFAEGMTLDFWHSEIAPEKAISVSGVTLTNFRMTAAGEDEKRKVELLFVAYLPASRLLADVAYGFNHNDFWVEAEYSQTEMEFSDVEDDEEPGDPSDDGDDDEDGPVLIVTEHVPAAVGSGGSVDAVFEDPAYDEKWKE